MKFIKGYKIFESRSEIDEICMEYDITNYTIKGDGYIDVNGDVDLSDRNLTKLPLKFGKVSGDFWCHNNQLTTLEGSPNSVGSSFYCNNNQLTTLKGGPNSIGDNFFCDNNQLTTLEGCPHSIGGNFTCYYNQLTSLEGGPNSVGGRFWCNDNQLRTLKGSPRSVGSFYCQNNQLVKLESISDILYDIKYHDNPIFTVCKGWLINDRNPDMDLVELFNDFDIIVGNKLYWSKLEYFHEEIDNPLPDIDEISKYYEVVN